MLQTIRHSRNMIPMHEDGFTLKEVVITVAIVLILSLVGFLSYQGFTDNARKSAVESAADELFNASISSYTLLGASPHSHVDSPESIVEQFNTSQDDIHAEVDHSDEGLTITTYGWDNNYSATRTTTSTPKRTNTLPPIPVEEVPPIDINDYNDGHFEFVTQEENSGLMFWNVSDDARITHHETGEITHLKEGMNIFKYPGVYSIHGGFEKMGLENPNDDTDDIVATTPFTEGSQITVWYSTGVRNIDGAFAGSSADVFLASPPDTVISMARAFEHAHVAVNLNHWNIENIENMAYAFHNAQSFSYDFDWDVSHVANTTEMFKNANLPS